MPALSASVGVIFPKEFGNETWVLAERQIKGATLAIPVPTIN